MVTTNESWFCYTNRSLTMKFVVEINTNGNPSAKKTKQNMVTVLLLIKSWFIYVREEYDSCIRIFLKIYCNDVVIIVIISTFRQFRKCSFVKS